MPCCYSLIAFFRFGLPLRWFAFLDGGCVGFLVLSLTVPVHFGMVCSSVFLVSCLSFCLPSVRRSDQIPAHAPDHLLDQAAELRWRHFDAVLGRGFDDCARYLRLLVTLDCRET